MYKCLYIVYCEWLNVVLCTVPFKEKRFFTPPESVRLYLCDLWITDTVRLDKIHREIYFCLILFTSPWMTVERFRVAGCIQTKTGGFTLIEHLLLTQWVFVYIYWSDLRYATMFTIHILDVKAALWIFHRLLILYLKSVMNFVPVFLFVLGFFFYRTEDAFVHHLTNRDLKNIFVAIVWDLYYIYFPNPDENAFLTMALEALYKLEIFISYHLAVFCHFYMFVMNKLFYSECIRLKECWLIFFSKHLTPITVNTIVPLLKAWVTL